MRNLFTRPQSNNSNSPTSEAKSLISFEIDARTKINITQKDLATILGLLTAGTTLSLCLALGFSQKILPFNTPNSIEYEKITKLSK